MRRVRGNLTELHICRMDPWFKEPSEFPAKRRIFCLQVLQQLQILQAEDPPFGREAAAASAAFTHDGVRFLMDLQLSDPFAGQDLLPAPSAKHLHEEGGGFLPSSSRSPLSCADSSVFCFRASSRCREKKKRILALLRRRNVVCSKQRLRNVTDEEEEEAGPIAESDRRHFQRLGASWKHLTPSAFELKTLFWIKIFFFLVFPSL